MSKKLSISLFILCSAAAGALLLFWLSRDTYATTVRLEETEGQVEVLSRKEQALSVRTGMRLLDGYFVSTEVFSAAYLSLDGTRAAKMDASSRLTIEAEGAKLALRLLEGKLFFSVDPPSEEGGQLAIRTSSAITGVREATGFLEVVNEDTARVYLLTGSLRVSAVSPVTGEAKEADILPGQRVTALVREAAKNEERVELVIDSFQLEDIPDFAAQELERDPALREQVLRETFWGLTRSVAIPNSSRQETPLDPVLTPEPDPTPEPFPTPEPVPTPVPPTPEPSAQPPTNSGTPPYDDGQTDYGDIVDDDDDGQADDDDGSQTDDDDDQADDDDSQLDDDDSQLDDDDDSQTDDDDGQTDDDDGQTDDDDGQTDDDDSQTDDSDDGEADGGEVGSD